AAAHADGADEAAAGTVRRRAGTAGGEIRAHDVPLDVTGRSRAGVVRAVQAVRAEEQLPGVRQVHRERDVELGPVAEVDPLLDEGVGEEAAAIREAIWRDAEVRAVDEA